MYILYIIYYILYIIYYILNDHRHFARAFFRDWDFITVVRWFHVKQNQVLPDADARSFNSFQLQSR